MNKGELQITYYKVENESDRYKAQNAWTLNVEALKEHKQKTGLKFTHVLIETEKALYRCTRELVDNAERLVLNGENKIILPVGDMEMIIK